ncbi:hypothetical protein BJ742DRAFT_860336, partial [Cladochytrium replicatum]
MQSILRFDQVDTTKRTSPTVYAFPEKPHGFGLKEQITAGINWIGEGLKKTVGSPLWNTATKFGKVLTAVDEEWFSKAADDAKPPEGPSNLGKVPASSSEGIPITQRKSVAAQQLSEHPKNVRNKVPQGPGTSTFDQMREKFGWRETRDVSGSREKVRKSSFPASVASSSSKERRRSGPRLKEGWGGGWLQRKSHLGEQRAGSRHTLSGFSMSSFAPKMNAEGVPMSVGAVGGNVSASVMLEMESNEPMLDDSIFADFDAGSLKSFMNPWTLSFRSPAIEEHFLRSQYLSKRVIGTRIIFLSASTINVVAAYVHAISHPVGDYSNAPQNPLIWPSIGLLISISTFFLILAFMKGGRYYGSLFIKSQSWRMFLMSVETAAFWLTTAFDLTVYGDLTNPVGSMAIATIPLLALTSGITSSFLERIAQIVVVLTVPCLRTIFMGEVGLWINLIAAVAGPKVASDVAAMGTVEPNLKAINVMVYWLPILLLLILTCGTCFNNDKVKRIRYIKTTFVKKRLESLQRERERTEYLLSVSLPKSVVFKLRETGLENIELIAERIRAASVMFGDLKNFTEISRTMGSMKDAIALLNNIFSKMDDILTMYEGVEKIKTIGSKILLVSGILANKKKRVSNLHPFHKRQSQVDKMIDLALFMKSCFTSDELY